MALTLDMPGDVEVRTPYKEDEPHARTYHKVWEHQGQRKPYPTSEAWWSQLVHVVLGSLSASPEIQDHTYDVDDTHESKGYQT